jgi:hypothetical protein
LFCAAPSPNFIITGAATVLVNGQPAARVSSKTLHPPKGEVSVGSANVLIGGPSGGAALGDGGSASPGAATDACMAARAGRHTPGRPAQSYGNCSLECARMIMNRERAKRGLPPLTEDEVLADAIQKGLAVNNPGKHNHGAASADGQSKILAGQGVPSDVVPQSPEAVQGAVAEGKGVIVTVNPYYWGPDVKPDCFHAIVVTGVVYDEDGNPKAYIISDTGLGVCGKTLTVAEFNAALVTGAPMPVSKARVW